MTTTVEESRPARFWTATRRQLAGRLAFLALVTVLTSLLYRVVCPQWVAYRDGENALARNASAQALGDYQRAIAGGAKTRQLPLHIAQALVKLNRPREAIPHLEPLRRSFPADEGAANLLAGIYDGEGRPADALHVYYDALEMGLPRSPDVLLHQADLFRELRRYRDAERLYLEVLATDSPVRREALHHLAELDLWTNRPAQALARYDELLHLDPTNRAAHIGRARALTAAGRRAEAVAEYRKLLPP